MSSLRDSHRQQTETTLSEIHGYPKLFGPNCFLFERLGSWNTLRRLVMEWHLRFLAPRSILWLDILWRHILPFGSYQGAIRGRFGSRRL